MKKQDEMLDEYDFSHGIRGKYAAQYRQGINININKQLEELYNKHWDNLIENGKKIQSPVPANPLLIKVDEKIYNQSDLKVMIFGQETWGWHKFSTTIDDGMNGYEKFFINKKFYEGYKKSAFWKGFN